MVHIKKKHIELNDAIDLGEYDPTLLSSFPEWKNLSRTIQFQLIRKALDVHYRNLIQQYAELNNVLDFSKKPHIQGALHNIEIKLKKFHLDKEKLYVEYSS